MNSMLNFGLGGFFLLLGAACLLSGILGDRFYFKNLGSRQEGPLANRWLARPFFIASGCALIYAAIDLFKHS